ncbi:MAG TPA: hypothetical protein VEH84_00400 [Alphaproteobacteria bacterium]|nr:hypothetical protein [Alphaproteobacteria bacterium]
MPEQSPLYQHLMKTVRRLPEDYAPFGEVQRFADPRRSYPDCSGGCRHFHRLKEEGHDWGVCSSPTSHRSGLLTFEHQGCQAFEPGDDALTYSRDG